MATKYTFISEDDAFGYPSERIVHEVKTVALPDILEHFERFLKGCGFVFEGQLDIVPPEEDYVPTDDDNIVLDMPGTTGSATLKFKDELCHGKGNSDTIKTQTSFRPVDSLLEKCNVCKLTRSQLGDHDCYDPRCGFKN